MGNVFLTVNGRSFGGWKEISITRSIQSVAGTFRLAVSNRWDGQDTPWPFSEEDRCSVSINGEPVITGYIDTMSHEYGNDGHGLALTGRDKTGLLVDCSLSNAWEFNGLDLERIARIVAGPFGITTRVLHGLKIPRPVPRVVVNPGDTAFEVLDRACRLAGVLPVSDGAGGLLLTRAGSERCSTALMEGFNVLGAQVEYDATKRYRSYLVMGQQPGTAETYGLDASSVLGQARDENVRRESRVLVVRAENSLTPEYAQLRAEWEATVRAARSGIVKVQAQGWTQADGSLWPVNAMVTVSSPLIRIEASMLIAEVTYTLSDSGGMRSDLTLMRADAFKPEPAVPVDPWKIADGK